jgi:hypothetical protein
MDEGAAGLTTGELPRAGEGAFTSRLPLDWTCESRLPPIFAR